MSIEHHQPLNLDSSHRANSSATDFTTATTFQDRVVPWLTSCFSSEIIESTKERGYRFLEEAVELVQAGGLNLKECLDIVAYVYSRPIGDLNQEVGGTMVTLAAFCHTHKLDMHDLAQVELDRCWQNIDKIREKQKTKPQAISVAAQPPFVSNALQQKSKAFVGYDINLNEDALDVQVFLRASNRKLTVDALENLPAGAKFVLLHPCHLKCEAGLLSLPEHTVFELKTFTYCQGYQTIQMYYECVQDISARITLNMTPQGLNELFELVDNNV